MIGLLTNLSAELYSKFACFLGPRAEPCGTFPHPISFTTVSFILPTLSDIPTFTSFHAIDFLSGFRVYL